MEFEPVLDAVLRRAAVEHAEGERETDLQVSVAVTVSVSACEEPQIRENQKSDSRRWPDCEGSGKASRGDRWAWRPVEMTRVVSVPA